ncbi:MAG: hypothetical protein ACYCZF_02995 [Anaerolineae bacterium]
MSQDRNQVPYIPNVQPYTINPTTQMEYRRLAIIAVGLVLAALAAGLYLRQASTVATYAHDIRELEVRKEKLRYEIQALRADSGRLGSLERLLAAAQQMGYHQLAASDDQNRQTVTYPLQPSSGDRGLGEEISTSAKTNQAQEANLFRRLWQRFQAWLRADPGT